MKHWLFFLFLLLLVQAGFQKELLRWETARTSQRRSLYLPSSDLLRLLSLGQKSLVSDLIVLGLIQYFVQPRQNRDPAWMVGMLDVATDLDPQNYHAWFYAANLMSFTPEERKASLEFLKLGIQKNPSDWRLPFWVSHRYYMMRDYDKAVEYAQQSAKIPGHPPTVDSFILFLYRKGEKYETAIAYLKLLMENATSEEEREGLSKKMQWLKSQWILTRAVEKYFQKFGEYPREIEDLVKGKILKKIPPDPWERGFIINPHSHEVEGKP